MPDRKVEDFAFLHKISFNEAKKRMGRRRRGLGAAQLPERGQPVAGTGKPGGGAKM